MATGRVSVVGGPCAVGAVPRVPGFTGMMTRLAVPRSLTDAQAWPLAGLLCVAAWHQAARRLS